MPFLLAILSAAVYGAADFIGGVASRRATTIAVVVVSQLAGLLVLTLLMPVLPDSSPSRADMAWGALAGVAGGSGVALLYRGLAIGKMALVAPTTAVCAVIVPVVADVLSGARLPAPVTAGIVLALIAIVLVSQTAPHEEEQRVKGRWGAPGLGLALASGVAIGFFFLALARTDASAGMWPLMMARVASVVLFAGTALVRRVPLLVPGPALMLTVSAGALDMAANALYLLATRGGELSIVVTLASLYPASTVLLANVVLHERLTRIQGVGIACALVAVIMIVSSS